jgi:hypothetical protein
MSAKRDAGQRVRGRFKFSYGRGVLIIPQMERLVSLGLSSLASRIPFALEWICFSNRYFIIISLYGNHRRLDAWLMRWRSNFDQSKMDHDFLHVTEHSSDHVLVIIDGNLLRGIEEDTSFRLWNNDLADYEKFRDKSYANRYGIQVPLLDDCHNNQAGHDPNAIFLLLYTWLYCNTWLFIG